MKNDRIAIIGAGISGLTAAHFLKEKGYQHIVIYEARDRIGGKIHTVEKDGCFYEIGGVFIQESFGMVKELMKLYGEPLSSKASLKTVILQGGKLKSNLLHIKPRFGLFKIARDFYGLWKILRDTKNIGDPALANSDPALFAHLNQLAEQRGINSIPGAVAPFVTGMGFGHVDKTPALYQLKLMKHAFGFAVALEVNNHLGTSIPGTFFAKNGYQNLLVKMASQFDVRLGTPVAKITRAPGSDAPIRITTAGGEEVFDRLIIATPPSDATKFLDMNPEETELLTRSRHFFFRSTLFRGENLPKGKMVFFPESNMADRLGLVNSFYNWHPQNDYYSVYQLYDDSISVNDLDAELDRAVSSLGGAVKDIVAQESFNYFPHYSVEDLTELKPYERLTALQGKNNTYFIGAAMSTESANDTALYAKELVQTGF